MNVAFSTDCSAEEIAVNKMALKQAFSCLTPIQLLILQLRYICDLPQADVAERLEITQGWVSILERRALNALREFLLEE